MTETSGLWTTDASPAGHQVVSYTQAIASTMHKILAACSGFEGVAPGYLSELAPSTTGDNNCRVAAGGAVVDGIWYNNTDNVDLTIDSPNAGHYRIDRVVVRATWGTTYTAVLTVIKNSVEDAAAPAITQTSGTTYDIQIAQVRVNEGGVIASVTDERTWAIVPTDDSTLEDDGAGALRVKDAGITHAKLAAGASKVTSRQGGSATVWGTSGSTDYTPTTARIQCGVTNIAISTGQGNGTASVTFPVAFGYAPIVWLSPMATSTHPWDDYNVDKLYAESVATTGFTVDLDIEGVTGAGENFNISWLAIGPE